MENVNLAPNEAVIFKETNVAHGGGMASCTDELILTNLNIICISKGVFGNTKRIFYYPLTQIKSYNGKPQVVSGKLPNGLDTLEIYFLNSNETFFFQVANKKRIEKWISAINNVLVGNTNIDTLSNSVSEYNRETVAGVLKEFGEDLKNMFGFKQSNGEQEKEEVVVNKKCIACSAPLIGKKGQVIHCKYCDTDQKV